MAKIKYRDSSGNYIQIPMIGNKRVDISQELGDSEDKAISQKAVTDELNKKQDKLESGVSIKTLNGINLLDGGNIEINPPSTSEVTRVTVSSNQPSPDNDILGKVSVRVVKSDDESELYNKLWEGSTLTFKIEPGVTYKVIPGVIDGYKSPSELEFTAELGGSRTLNFSYYSELVNVTLSSDDDSDVSSQTITITDNNGGEVIATGTGSLSVKIEHEIQYTISVNDKSGYTTPSNQTFTANQISRNINLQYKKIQAGKIKISKTISDPASMITTEGDEILQTLLSRFRRCLGKSTEDNKINICYLRDDNSNYYHDGSDSILTGSEGDVFVYFPEFWYLGTDSDSEWIFNISLEYKEGYHHAPASLVGTYKGYVTGSKLYSRSGVERTTNISMANFSTYSRSRGAGYHIIDYQQHCIIAWMFYARYKNTNSQAICGTGSDSWSGINNGTTNTLGITDTTPPNANSSSNILVNFLGIEGCWGYVSEFIEGIHEYLNPSSRVSYTYVYDKGDFHDLEIDNIISPTTRIVPSSNGYISKIEGGEYMDTIGILGNGGSTSYFCDYTYISIGSSQVFHRSYTGNDSLGQGGIIYLRGSSFSDSSESSTTSRLAFDGEITVIESPTEFKAITGFR